MEKNKKNKSVKAWVNRHLTDHYVHLANKDGYRSRAAYKLLEIDKEFNIFNNKIKRVVDLGCAPGSWSQVACKKVGDDGMVVGVDLLDIQPVHNLHFIQGDFTENEVLDKLIEMIDNTSVDLVISDMAPNLSGIKGVDQSRQAYLVELVVEFAKDYLKTGGNCVIKVFHGSEFDNFVKKMRELFTKVTIYKPESSRQESSEVFLIGRSKK